jgi:hydroxyacylglutathione hydrolase
LHNQDIEVIPTPGHTDGGLSFLYNLTKGKSILFTGDTLFQSNSKWSTLVYTADGGNRSDMLETLEIYRKLQPNIVISSGYSGDRCIVEIDPLEWDMTIDEVISSV